MKRLGFVIANDIEEYLLSSSNSDNYSINLWYRFPSGILNPDNLRIFSSSKDAQDFVRHIDSSHKIWVLVLFETHNQYAVSSLGNDAPGWISKSSMSGRDERC